MDRIDGITMLLRLKNEDEWIEPCLRSIEWADQIVLCFQNSTDSTEEIARSILHPDRSSYYHYPHDSRSNGPGHDNQPYDEFNRAYFYNWCYAKTNTKYVVKWDGDMVAMDTLQDIMCSNDHHRLITIYGTNIVIKNDTWNVNIHNKYCGREPRYFLAEDKDPWTTGKMCERFCYPKKEGNLRIQEPQFLHFKYGKNVESMTTAWPTGWEEQSHFQELYKRGNPDNPTDLQPYDGPMPSCLKDYAT